MRVTRSRELVDAGYMPAAVARVAKISRQAIYRTPKTRPPGRGRPALRDAIDRLAADLRHARHRRGRVALGDQLAGPGDAHAYSQSRKSFPAISNS